MASVDLVKQGADRLSIGGLTGATAASRYVGATASGAPATGTFAVGDFVIDQTGKIHVCTTAGSPGTWTAIGGSGGGGGTADTVGVVVHGATAGTARPSGFGSIQWIGSVEPTNAADNDTWIDTTP